MNTDTDSETRLNICETKLMDKTENNKNSESLEDVSATSCNILKWLISSIQSIKGFYKNHKQMFVRLFWTILIIVYLVYFICSMVYDFSKSTPLQILTAIVVVIVVYEKTSHLAYKRIKDSTKNIRSKSKKQLSYFKRFMIVIPYLVVFVLSLWVTIDIIRRDPQQLVSLFGTLAIIFTCTIFSKHPSKINWRAVIWGVLLQFTFGLLTLRTNFGYNAVKVAGEHVVGFLSFTSNGTSFVLGDTRPHFFVFQVLPIIVFFSSVTSVLYYLGFTQWFIQKLAFWTQITLGVSAFEAIVAIANIFVGMLEAPLLILPYLEDLTLAQIHCIMTVGLGSIGFDVAGVYIKLGIDPVQLLTACVLSAPASLVVSSILYPETEKSKFDDTSNLKLDKGKDNNIVEAAAAGASRSITLIANILAILIAFIALIAFLDATVAWFASFVGYDDMSFQKLCGFIFIPVAFMMGVDVQDCLVVGEVFGMKTIVNEFVAYERLVKYTKNQMNGIQISKRSETIAIYALCGFSNLPSIGIMVGGLGALIPSKKSVIAKMALRALLAASLSCCMKATIAGALFQENFSLIMTTNTTNLTVV